MIRVSDVDEHNAFWEHLWLLDLQSVSWFERSCDGIHVPFDPCIVTIYTLRGCGGDVRAEGVRSGPSPFFLYIPTKTLFQR